MEDQQPGAEAPPVDVVVFAPTPTLTVTIEEVEGAPDIHLHAGGQGVWQARMAKLLGSSVEYCALLSGETGRVIGHLLEDEGIHVRSVSGHAASSAYVHDRRAGHRDEIAAAPGDRLSRHELDELHGLVLREGLLAKTAVLSGAPRDDAVPVDMYRRLASDLRSGGCRVIADLSGDRLEAAISGGLELVKVAHNEMMASGRAESDDPDELVRAMRSMAADGAKAVVLTRGAQPALFLDEDNVSEIRVPELQVVDEHGAGDSMTGAIAAALAAGESVETAVILGASAGANNVTRHGLGSGDADSIRRLAALIEVAPFDEGRQTGPIEQASPEDLARKAKVQ
ncbi:PfkB family carbohydrate kinase [Sinomonas terrae]|uniref:PfkB family carbohydrate kinase n=1 Tax=Sinomonas terrae TaxID=2908838 RepID=A0ABS9U5U8_9MICC|nr:PfkB family carbohydrate kinase [Sinomonas terrae]MCH6471777.1 PfkB family carbohydrate kinase [Sinomonas terrae]